MSKGTPNRGVDLKIGIGCNGPNGFPQKEPEGESKKQPLLTDSSGVDVENAAGHLGPKPWSIGWNL